MKRFEGRVAVVTGGASGIGLSAVERLLSEGACVLINDLSEENGRLALANFQTSGNKDRVDFVAGDVSSEAVVDRAMSRAVSNWGRLDVALLNAGLGGAFGSLLETTVEDWDQTFAYLVRSVFLGLKHATAKMGPEGGSIVATASVAGIGGGGGSHAYSAAKAAVISLVRSAALEFAPRRIRVNAVAPGVIITPLVHRGNPRNIPDVSGKQPWPEHGRPENIASALAYLASDEAQFVTGETLVVDGGLLANSANIWGDKSNLLFGRTGMNRGSTGLSSTFRAAPPIEDK